MAKNATRTLPSNIITILPTLAMEQVATAASIADERARAARPGSRSAAFWMGRREAARAEAERRGWHLYRHPGDRDYIAASRAWAS